MSAETENLSFLKEIIRLKFSCRQDELDNLLDNAKYVEALFAIRSELSKDPLSAPASSESGEDGFFYVSVRSNITMTWEKKNKCFPFLTEIPITGMMSTAQDTHHYYINELDHLVTNIMLHLMADKYFRKSSKRLRSGTKNARQAKFNTELTNYRDTLIQEIIRNGIEA